MSAANRKTVRAAFAALLESQLVGDGKPAAAVYAGQIADFKGKSPVVVVAAGGTQRERLTFKMQQATHWLDVHIFVVYATEDGQWDELDAEDALDDIEYLIGQTVGLNQVTENWGAITHEGRSDPAAIVVGGIEYRTEIVRLRFN